MKYNLKNRPKIEFHIIRRNKKEAEAMDEFIAWAEGLEKELKQIKIQRFHDGKIYCANLTKEERWGSQWCVNLIEEILGEETKS